MDRKNVLIVDDEPHIVNLVKLGLDQERYNIHGANSGREAMEVIKEIIPDIVILDLMMPGINGYDMCQALKDNEKQKMCQY